MTAPASHAHALIRFNLAQQLRGLRWYLGLVTCIAIVTAGFFLADEKHSFLGTGLYISFAIMFSFNIAQDRITGFEDYALNFVSPRAFFVCQVIAAIMLWVTFCVITVALTALLWREPRLALWGVTRMFLLIAFLIPVALITETLIDLRYSALVALAVCAAILMFNIASDERGKRFFEFFGLDVSAGSFASLSRLALVAAIWNVLLTLVAFGIWSWRHRPHTVHSQ